MGFYSYDDPRNKKKSIIFTCKDKIMVCSGPYTLCLLKKTQTIVRIHSLVIACFVTRLKQDLPGNFIVLFQVLEKYPNTPMSHKEILQVIQRERLKEIR